VEAWRFGIRVPGHAQLMNALTWMSHLQNLRRVAREHRIDLYLRPPVSQYRLLDYRLMDRIVREAGRYAFVAVSDWQRKAFGAGGVGGALGGLTGGGALGGSAPLDVTGSGGLGMGSALASVGGLAARSRSIACMTQLQAKQTAASGDDDDSEGVAGGIEEIPAPLLLQRAATLPLTVLTHDTAVAVHEQQQAGRADHGAGTLGAQHAIPQSALYAGQRPDSPDDAASIATQVGAPNSSTGEDEEVSSPLLPVSRDEPGSGSQGPQPVSFAGWAANGEPEVELSLGQLTKMMSGMDDASFKYLEHIQLDLSEDDLPFC
jgi:hypothetical protein